MIIPFPTEWKVIIQPCSSHHQPDPTSISWMFDDFWILHHNNISIYNISYGIYGNNHRFPRISHGFPTLNPENLCREVPPKAKCSWAPRATARLSSSVRVTERPLANKSWRTCVFTRAGDLGKETEEQTRVIIPLALWISIKYIKISRNASGLENRNQRWFCCFSHRWWGTTIDVTRCLRWRTIVFHGKRYWVDWSDNRSGKCLVVSVSKSVMTCFSHQFDKTEKYHEKAERKMSMDQ